MRGGDGVRGWPGGNFPRTYLKQGVGKKRRPYLNMFQGLCKLRIYNQNMFGMKKSLKSWLTYLKLSIFVEKLSIFTSFQRSFA